MMNTATETKKQIYIFLLVLIILTSLVFIWMFNKLENSRSIAMLMMWVPGISAIITTIITKDNFKSYGWNPGKVKYLLYAYFIPFIVAIIAYGAVWILGLADFTPDEVKNYRWAAYIGFSLPAPFWVGFISKAILYTVVVSVYTLGEEIGWSGFLTPKLLKIKSIPVTGIIIGLIWSIWHFPAIVGGIYGFGAPLWISLPSFSLVLIGNAVIATILIAKSKSFWPGVVLHSSHNIILMSMFWEMTVKTKYASYFVSETGIITAIVYLAIAFVFWKLINRK